MLVEYHVQVTSENIWETIKTDLWNEGRGEHIKKMITDYGDKEPHYYPSSNIIHPYISIYRIMKLNLDFFKKYEKLINEIWQSQ